MAEDLASAVTLPDQDTITSPPETSLKRKSSITDPETKRRRLSSHDDNNRDNNNRNEDRESASDDRRRSSAGIGTEPAPDKERKDQKDDRKPSTRPPGRRDDERKRGQRLFGGLLGTLSQSSTSTAQRRRADIERRQQDKLKLQDVEYGEVKKKRQEDRMAIRKKEQRVYEEESMRTRHSNLLAMARFFKTKTEPALYYKPWQLRPRDEDIIQDQIEEAEETITREVAEFEARYLPPKKEEEVKENPVEDSAPLPQSEPKEESNEPNEPEKPEETTHEQASDTVGAETNQDVTETTGDTLTTNGHDHNDAVHAPPPDVHHDDGGEVVEEDNEDTVIY